MMLRHALPGALLAWSALATPVAAEIGWQRLSLAVPHHPTPLEGVMLYPAASGGTPTTWAENPVFEGVAVEADAAIAATGLPVILLSHGLGGQVRALSWLAGGLAARGAIVVAVNHPGSTTADFDMRGGLDHWLRAADLGATLDALVADPAIGPHLDPGRVFAAGFSYGGFTALSLVGLRADLAGYAAHCEAVGEASSHCADIQRAGVDLRALDATLWNADHGDPRIKAAAAIDPGLTYGIDATAVAGIDVPVLLVTLGSDADRLLATDVGDAGSGFAALLPKARHLVLEPANHFTALPVCQPAGAAILAEEGDDPVCTDPAGTDRAAVHQAIVDATAEHFGLRGR